MLLNIAVIFSTALLSSVTADGPSTTSSSSAAPAATHIVAVGVDNFNFLPQETYANVGDVIDFQFYPLNHSVVRASYGSEACVPYEYTTIGQLGFFSGFVPVATSMKNPPSWQVTVNDTAPIFFYCSQTDACFQGMVGVINPNATQTFKSQMAYALNATVEFSPGQTFLPEAFPTTSFSRTTTYTGATAPPTIAPATTTTAAPLPSLSPSSSTLPTGAIVGIAIGSVAVLALAAALIYMCARQKTVKDILRQSNGPTNPNSYQPQPSSPGLSEANYMQKEPNMAVSQNGHFSAQSFAPPTERSMSPPVDEHTGMMGMHPLHAGPRGYSPGIMSPGMLSPNSPGYPSPVYTDALRHEMGVQGVRPFNPNETGPHELAVPTPNTSPHEQNEHRPFSYTDSESGYARPSEKSETDTY